MKSKVLLIGLLLLSCWAIAQQVEPVRYEVDRWSKDQDCHFQRLGSSDGIMVYETDRINKDKQQRLWDFACLDSSLYETRNDLIPLPEKLNYFDSDSDGHYAAFLFVNDGNKKAADTLDFLVVSFDRKEGAYKTFWDRWPEKSVPLSVKVVDGTMMLALNNKSGNGSLVFYDLTSNACRTVSPSPSTSFVLFQTEAFPKQHCFVVAAKEYENKHFVSTSFLVYSPTGKLQGSYRYENIPNAALGRMGFRFDEDNLVVIGTLERETGRKVKLEGVTEDFDKESLGVVWMRFVSGTPDSHVYLFKDMPEIEHALTASDRVRVREERLKNQKKTNTTKGEIAFQFLSPRITDFGDLTVFTAEAFMPYYHTETRMGYGYYGYYGGYPYTYTVFDGYDFFSEIILAFDHEGHLRWQQSVKFDNELTYNLYSHASEGVCYDELVVASPYRNNLRYTAFDANGQVLMNQQNEKLDPIHGADYVEDEYFAQLSPWYGSRFLIYGSQIIQNSTQPKARRTVFYLQKIQYD